MRSLTAQVFLVVAAIGLVAGCSAAATTPTTRPLPTGSLAEGMNVSIGSRSLWLRCVGSGSPTVILESGMTGDHRTWEDVMSGLQSQTRVCTYDRANIQPSEQAAKARTAALAVQDLRALLDAAAIKAPYVLVGFSLGGIISQLYAATHASDIAGLVLVDSNHPNEDIEFNKHLTRAQIDADRAETLQNFEGFDPFESLKQARAAGPLPKV